MNRQSARAPKAGIWQPRGPFGTLLAFLVWSIAVAALVYVQVTVALIPTLLIALVLLFIILPRGMRADDRRAKERLGEGRLLQGTPRLTVAYFNRRATGLSSFGRLRLRLTGRHPNVIALRLR